ncbi:PE-PGRS family protein [Dyadobacter sp. CY323]|uniref:PE-PGRS family protein n=1 Tax=Dyadobacter sp. CY323 TaxID=2907302 RepID=UPI001F402419|nr:PE-PGRS family protein [Dyadobacter sp. CY323]MCE6990946.1 PE-PGRS family protein [Dyadobacter sp. CY323]
MNKYKGLGNQGWIVICSLVLCITCSCDPDPNPGPGNGNSDQFESTPQKFPITPGTIDEASGLAPSLNFPGYLWTNQDSGQPNSLYLVSKDGKTIKEYGIPGAQNNDWEDVAIGPGPENGVNYLYIADTGNNGSSASKVNVIYRVPEISDPNASFSQDRVEKITYKYPDGPRDAESLLLDPVTKDIFIVSKESSNTGIYRLAFPQSTGETITAEKLGTVPSVSTATGGSISKDGNEIAIRTYLSVYYWKRKTGETIGQTLTQPATRQLLVAIEPQGESICFDSEGSGFYTLSEKSNSTAVTLNFYKRK